LRFPRASEDELCGGPAVSVCYTVLCACPWSVSHRH